MGVPKYINPQSGSDSNSGDSALQARASPPTATDNMDFLFCDDTHYVRSSQWNIGAAANTSIGRYSPNGVGSRPKITVQAPGSTNAINYQGDGEHRIQDVEFPKCTSNTNGGIVGSGLVAATGKGANLLLIGVVAYDCNWNFVRINVGGSQAPDSFRMLGCDLDRIGEDGIFGGASQFEVAYSSIKNPSRNTTTGDCIGFFNADPTRAWIHHNYLFHPLNYKQVVIFDPTNVGAGMGIVEDNVMIGYCGENSTNHVIFNTEVPTILRRNYMMGAGILIAFNADACVAEANICEIRGYRPGSTATEGSVQFFSSNTRVDHNLFLADRVYDQSATGYLVSTGSGRSGNAFRNNILMNIAKGVQRGNGTTLALSNNCLYNVATPYVDHLGGAISSTNDLLADPRLRDLKAPWLGLESSSPCRGAGAYVQGARDRFGRRYAERNIGPWAVLEAA